MTKRFTISFSICWMLSLAMVLPVGQTQEGANSTTKSRVKPNAISAKIGSGVKWNKSVAAALELASKDGKKVLWYVPSLPNTFMDRKQEVDQYMLSGPFSWPPIVDLINQNFVPVRALPDAKYQEQYKLNPYDFVEPGILILDANGEAKFSIDRLTTIHPQWLLQVLEKQLNVTTPKSVYSADLQPAWEQFAKGDYAAAKTMAAEWESKFDAGTTGNAESGLLLGMAQFRSGDHAAAKTTWERVAQANPDHPLGWKASAEAQGIGPFGRGFEIHRNLADGAFAAGVDSAGSAAPKGVYSEPELWKRSTEFLLGMQDASGGFFDSDYDFGGSDSLPNVYVAVTSLAGMALIDAYDQAIADSTIATQEKIQDAVSRALAFCLDSKRINRVDRDEILWAYAYRLRFVAKCKQHKTLNFPGVDLDKELGTCIETLQSVQSRRGNWYHEYGNPFVTATALLALKEAAEAGGNPSTEVTDKGVESLSNDRFENGAYPYDNRRAGRPKGGTDRDIAASAGRMPVCELALHKFGKIDDEALAKAIRLSLDLHKNLDMALKYDNHTSNMAYGGFFFWYDMRARSEAILAVEDETLRQEFQSRHKALVMALPELDGCFIDSHELGRVYGTAMALQCLANVNKK